MWIIQKSKELYQVLRKWFDAVCSCDGLNNLYGLHVTCVDDKVGIITSTVHSDSKNDKTAQMLIDLAKLNIQRRDPPEVKISSDWIICLSEDCGRNDEESGMSLLLNMIMQLFIKNVSCINVS